MEASLAHLPTKFGYKQAYGWKVMNPNIVLQVSVYIWPHLTFDLLTWPLTLKYCGGQHRASLEATKFGYKHAYGWKVINRNRVLRVNFHILPLTYLHDLWPQKIVEANIGHLSTKFGYKHAYGWKVTNHNKVLQVNFHIWPHLTFDLLTWSWPQNIVEANIGHLQYSQIKTPQLNLVSTNLRWNSVQIYM